MGPKKAKKAKKNAGDEDEIDVGEQLEILKAQRDSLQQRLVLEQERADRAKAKRDEFREESLAK